MPAYLTTFVLAFATTTLVINTFHLAHLRRRLTEIETYYDLALRTLSLLSEKSVRNELQLLEGEDFLDAAVKMAMKQLEEEIEEDEDDE